LRRSSSYISIFYHIFAQFSTETPQQLQQDKSANPAFGDDNLFKRGGNQSHYKYSHYFPCFFLGLFGKIKTNRPRMIKLAALEEGETMKKQLLAVLLLLVLVVSAVAIPAIAADEPTAPVKGFAKNGLPGARLLFSKSDFTAAAGKVTGILITSVPSPVHGVLTTGRISEPAAVAPGQVVDASELDSLCFIPTSNEEMNLTMEFIPLYKGSVQGVGGKQVSVGLNLMKTRNFAPAALPLNVETGRGMPMEIMLKAYDPEGDELTFHLYESSNKGEVRLSEDGVAVFIPAENKKGKTTFSYYTSDVYGNTSEVTEVVVNIEKPKSKTVYADIAGTTLEYAALKLEEMGVYAGEVVGGTSLFRPEEPVTRGEFVAMVMAIADRKPSGTISVFAAEADAWQQGYLTAAIEDGLLVSGNLRPADAITKAEAVTVMDRLLNIAGKSADIKGDIAPAWAAQAAANLEGFGVYSPNESLSEVMTRGEAALLLYRASLVQSGQRLGLVTP
jgi:hypothetical protein